MKKTILIGAHILFWGMILSFFLFVLGQNVAKSLKFDEQLKYIIIHFGLYGLVNISIFYFNLLVLIPYTAEKKKYVWYFISILLTIFAYSLIKYFIAYHFKEYYLTVGPNQKEIPKLFYPYIISTFFPSAFMIGFSIIYKMIVDWVKNDAVQRELKLQKTQAELQFLKSQINPHFLFNSLNNIYSLAYKKSDDAPDAILKLSEIMRYMLKESEDGKVDINDEIQYLKSYIELNRIRYKEGVFLDINIDIDKNNNRIMPMLLISFIENIFKHGVVNDEKHPVVINIFVKDSVLNFFSANVIRTGNKDDSSGIGLRNIYRRLDLMYDKNYTMKINQDNNQFQLSLMIKL